MDCEAFFAAVDARLGDALEEPNRTTTSGQCVVDFFHPRTVERLGADGVVTAFNRSGVVWAPPARRLRARIRVPDAYEDAVAAALAAGPLPVERTDHRGASAPGGEMVTLLHFTVRGSDLDDERVLATLSAVADALRV